VAFYLVLITLFVEGRRVTSADERFSMGVIWTIFVFICLNVVWLARRLANFFRERSSGPADPLEVSAQLRALGIGLNGVALATLTGWLLVASIGDNINFWPMAIWGLIAGPIIFLGGRSLRKRRRPGPLPLVLAMVPFSPAVVLGLPVALMALRTLNRPEVRSFFDAKPATFEEL
jgi:hypothetical protein